MALKTITMLVLAQLERGVGGGIGHVVHRYKPHALTLNPNTNEMTTHLNLVFEKIFASVTQSIMGAYHKNLYDIMDCIISMEIYVTQPFAYEVL